RVRHGDVNVSAPDTVTAHNLQIAADDGSISVAGKIDASGDKGGRIALLAGKTGADGAGKVNLLPTGVLDAHATNAAMESAGSLGDGGKVFLATSTSDGTL